jgi:sigma-E factor negative regulatory protein RseA
MSEQSREQISALMDGELENGAPFILNALENSQEYRETWHRYHLIGESLRGNLPKHVDIHLADRIRTSIQNEPAILAPARNTTRNQIFKPAIGFAIAASVTVAVILGVKQTGVGPASTTPAPVVAVNQTEAPASYPVVRVTAEPSIQNPSQNYGATADAQTRLNRYLVNHNEYRSNVGVQGMLPYVRIVAHEVEE